ncbi:MAG: DUF2191 domain-containing protein [Gemmatimonadetes bacterium]|nr:DUF2191 domain-containing protein [Gemmatimonadota bacterium]
MRTTVDIEGHLVKRLRAEAHRQGVSFKEFLHRVLRRGLEERRSDAPGPYRCPTFAMGQPLRPLDKALAIADSLEDEEIASKLALRK